MVRAILIALLLSSCDMALQEKYGVHGMITNPNAALTERMRRGALSRSHNTVHRRPGTAEPRPGFVAFPNDFDPWKILAYDGDLLAVGTDAGVFVSRWLGSVTDIEEETATSPIEWSPDYVQGAEARGNLYLTTSDAVRKVTASGDVVSERAHGVVPPMMLLNEGGGTVFPDSTKVAYRATSSREDANGVIVTSRPSTRFVLHVTAGPSSGSVALYLDSAALAGDIVKLFRSTTVVDSLRPSDDMRLVAEIVLTAAHITAGLVAHTDTVVDADRGASLYSNPTREGIERSNVSPPLARDLAVYKGSLFAGRVTYPPALDFQYNDSSATLAAVVASGTRANASAVIAVTSAAGLKIGMILLTGTFATWSGSAAVRITGIAGTDITMSETWSGATDGAPVSLSFANSIRIKSATEDQYYPAVPVVNFTLAVNSNLYIAGTPSIRIPRSAEFVVEPLSDIDGKGTGTATTYTAVRIAARLPSHAGFEVFATNGALYQPALPEPTVSTGLASSQDDFPNGVVWSKQDEPEHFMVGRHWLVGNKAPIMRIVAAGDYLYVLKGKGDGIYRLSGYGERSGWRVDPVSADTYLIHPDAVVVHEETVFAVTNNGIVAINEAGVSKPIDEPIADQTGDLAKDSEAFLTVSTERSFAAFAAYTRDDELIFGLPDPVATDGEAAHKVFVYHIENRAWSTWFDDDTIRAAVVNPADQLLYLVDAAGNVLRERDRTTDAVLTADTSYLVTVTSALGLQLTIAGGSGWTPAVGDLFFDGADYAIVASIASPTVFTVSNAIATGAGTAYKAYTSEITWLPHFDPNGAMRKRYSAVYTHWDDTFGLYRWDIDVSGTGEGDAQEWDDTIPYDRASRRRDTRMLLSADVAFQSQLYTTLAIAQAGARWRVNGITLEARAAGRRVHH